MRIATFLTFILALGLCMSSCKNDSGDDQVMEPTGPVEDFYNIVIQDEFTTPPSQVSVFYRVENSNGEPIADLLPDDFTVFERGRNDDDYKVISSDEGDRVITDNELIFRYNVMLLLDLSASVTNNHLPEIKEAASQFIQSVIGEGVNTSTRIGIFWFDGEENLHQLIDFTNNYNELQDAVNDINSDISQDASTNLFGAIINGTELIKGAINHDQLTNFLSAGAIITFTDGTDQAGIASRTEAYDVVDSSKNTINYYTIGLGSEIDETVLNNLGPKKFISAENGAELNESFTEISDLIYNEVNSFYLFEYCTPKRDGSGINALKIKLEKVDGEGDVETQFDAKGFRSGCELN